MSLLLTIILWLVVGLLVVGCVVALAFLAFYVAGGIKDMRRYKRLKKAKGQPAPEPPRKTPIPPVVNISIDTALAQESTQRVTERLRDAAARRPP
jgi:hypothetical protein